MNVLAKIVIPKTNVTMGYINNELEELAREEFFRLKKVLEIKRKMYGGRDKKKGKTEDGAICETCFKDTPVCETCIVEDKEEILSKDVESVEEVEPKIVDEDKSLKLEEVEKLIKQLNEVVGVTKKIGDKGLIDVSVDEFIKTAEELKEKLGQKSEIQQEESESLPSGSSIDEDGSNALCDECRAKFSEEEREKQSDKMSVSTKPSCSSQCSRETVQFKESSSPSVSENSDSDLGTFETEYKEITKIIKTKNKDGSIIIKKKVIKVEKEIKSPANKSLPSSSRVSYRNKSNMTHQSSSSSTKSNPYSGSKTVGLVKIKTPIVKSKMQRKVKSEVLTSFLPMSDPVERSCMSSITLLSTDLDIDLIRPESTKKDDLNLLNNEVKQFLSGKMNVLKKIVIPRTNITIGYILTELEEMAREEFHRLKKVKEKKKRDSDERESRNKKEKPVHIASNICDICNIDKNDQIYKDSDSNLSARSSTITLKPEPGIVSEFQNTSIPSSSRPLQSNINFENNLKYLKDNINKIIAQAKEFLNTTMNSFDTNEFLTMCKEVKLDLEQLLAPIDYRKSEEKTLGRKLEHLKCHLHEVIDIVTEIKKEEVISTRDKDLTETCETVNDKLNINSQVNKSQISSDRSRLIELKDILKGVEKITDTYKKQSLLSPSVEFFIDACRQMQLKLDQSSNSYCYDNMKISNNLKKSEDFKVDTRNFKTCVICNSNDKYIDENVDVQGKQDDFITRVNNFVKSSTYMEDYFKCKTPIQLQDLQLNLEEIIKLIMKQNEAETLSQSLEYFTKSFSENKNVNCNQNNGLRNKTESSESSCISTCMMNENLQENKLIENQPLKETLMDTPCSLCNELTNVKQPSNESVCTYCTHPRENVGTSTNATKVPSKSSDERASLKCSSCKKPITLDKKSQIIEIHDEVTSSSEGSSCKYFKKEFKKKTKVKRKLKTDGSIWEKRKVTTINRKKHDSKVSSLSDDDDYDDTCEDSFDEDDLKQINICLTTNNIEHGFVNFLKCSQSEVFFKDTLIPYPRVKYCLSIDKFICNIQRCSSSSSCSSLT